MKVWGILLPVCLYLFCFGCSRDDQPPSSPPSPKVVQTIKQALPAQERAPAVPEKDISERKPEDKPDEVPQDPAPKPVDDPPADVNPPTPPVLSEPPPRVAAETRPGRYLVKEGDTLSKIAARQDTMQDPLRWPILLRLNLESLADLETGADFADREVPPGTELRVITPTEAKAGVEKPAGSRWAVNVLSTPREADIVPPAVTLAKQGFPAYITRANVKGKEFWRLRVGFFRSKEEAKEQGEKIKTLLEFKEFWTTRVDTAEYEELAGFLKNP